MHSFGASVTVLFVSINLCSAWCPHGWSDLQGLCLSFPSQKMTWTEANNYCRTLHKRATLVVAKTNEQYSFLTEHLKHRKLHWLGVSDRVTEDIWMWEDGTVAKNLPWLRGEPNNMHGSENCALINRDRLLDINCHSRRQVYHFACSVPPTQCSLLEEDCQNRECPVDWRTGKHSCYRAHTANTCSGKEARKHCENLDCGAVPVHFQKINDDVVEVARNTGQTLFHVSDNHTLSIENSQTTVSKAGDLRACGGVLCERPHCPHENSHRCPSPAKYYDGRCNQLIEQRLTRPEAESACRRLHDGARLASVRSVGENDLLMAVAAPGGEARPTPESQPDEAWFWLGLVRAGEKHAWRWEDGSESSAQLWGCDNNRGEWGVLDVWKGNWAGVSNRSEKKYPALCQWSL